MALTDSNNFITHLVWSGLINKATCGELKEAIELCTVKDTFSKADMVAMLTKLQLEIEEINVNKLGNNDVDKCSNIYIGVNCCKRILASKIDKLKETD